MICFIYLCMLFIVWLFLLKCRFLEDKNGFLFCLLIHPSYLIQFLHTLEALPKYLLNRWVGQWNKFWNSCSMGSQVKQSWNSSWILFYASLLLRQQDPVKPEYSKIYHCLFFSLNKIQFIVKGVCHITDYIFSLPILWVTQAGNIRFIHLAGWHLIPSFSPSESFSPLNPFFPVPLAKVLAIAS